VEVAKLRGQSPAGKARWRPAGSHVSDGPTCWSCTSTAASTAGGAVAASLGLRHPSAAPGSAWAGGLCGGEAWASGEGRRAEVCARQKYLPSTQDLETPSMGRSEPYNGEAAGGMAWGNEPTPSPHEATRVPSSRCVRVLCVKLTSYRRLATPRCMCPHVLLFFNPDEYVVFLDAFKISNLQAPVLYMLQKSSSSRQTTRV